MSTIAVTGQTKVQAVQRSDDIGIGVSANVVRVVNSSVGAPGNQNVYIQQTQPTATPPWVWWQTDGSGNLVTLWIST